MIEVGKLLYFIPPMLAGGEVNVEKIKRIMLIISINTDNTLTLINLSKVKGKSRDFTCLENYVLKNYFPLPTDTFAKMKSCYFIENFSELQNYIYKHEKINNVDLQKIKELHIKFFTSDTFEQVFINKRDFNYYNT